MLPKENRLNQSAEIEALKRDGELIRGRFFLTLFSGREGKVPSQFAFIVSLKVSKKAAERNRLKRILREETRLLLKNVKGGFKVLFIIRKEALATDATLLRQDLRRVLKEAKILK